MVEERLSQRFEEEPYTAVTGFLTEFRSQYEQKKQHDDPLYTAMLTVLQSATDLDQREIVMAQKEGRRPHFSLHPTYRPGGRDIFITSRNKWVQFTHDVPNVVGEIKDEQMVITVRDSNAAGTPYHRVAVPNTDIVRVTLDTDGTIVAETDPHTSTGESRSLSVDEKSTLTHAFTNMNNFLQRLL